MPLEAATIDETSSDQEFLYTLNFGPQHPATHTTLRLILTLDGETIVKAVPDIGYLHSGFEKLGEELDYNQYVTIADRMNYLSPVANEIAWHHVVEKLLGVELTPGMRRYVLEQVSRDNLAKWRTRLSRAEVDALLGGVRPGEAVVGEEFGEDGGDGSTRWIVDPIDGTRLLMHQKSSGWILAGIAPEKGDATRLGDIFFSLQTELPPLKQVYADILWTSSFSAVSGVRANLLTGEETPLLLPADPATDLRHGFVSFVNLFARGKALLALFAAITVPAIRPITIVIITLSLAGSLKVFDYFAVMTGVA